MTIVRAVTEFHSGGTLAGFGVTTTYTSGLQCDTLACTDVSGGYSVAHGCDPGGRLPTVAGNGPVSQYPSLESKAVNGASTLSRTGKAFVPPVSEYYQYDLDGNLTQDGRWTYTWDGENRLVKQESLANAPAGSERRLEYAYDHLGRRIGRQATHLDANTVLSKDRYLYDGWNLEAELPASSSTSLRTYVWGADLSGAAPGAGGVGGLLWVNEIASSATHCYCHVGLLRKHGR